MQRSRSANLFAARSWDSAAAGAVTFRIRSAFLGAGTRLDLRRRRIAEIRYRDRRPVPSWGGRAGGRLLGVGAHRAHPERQGRAPRAAAAAPFPAAAARDTTGLRLRWTFSRLRSQATGSDAASPQINGIAPGPGRW